MRASNALQSAMEGGGRVLSGAGGSSVWRAWEVNGVHSSGSRERGGGGGSPMHESSSESPTSRGAPRRRHATATGDGVAATRKSSARGLSGSAAHASRGRGSSGARKATATAVRSTSHASKSASSRGRAAVSALTVDPLVTDAPETCDATLADEEADVTARASGSLTPPARHRRRSVGDCVPGPRDAVGAVTLRVPGTSPCGSAMLPREHASAIAAALAVDGGDGLLVPRTVIALLTDAGLAFVATDLAAPGAPVSARGGAATAAHYTSEALDSTAQIEAWGPDVHNNGSAAAAAATTTGAWIAPALADNPSVFDRYHLPAAFTAPLAAPHQPRPVPARVEEVFEAVRVCARRGNASRSPAPPDFAQRLTALGRRVSEVDDQLLALQRAFTAFTNDVSAQMSAVIAALDAHAATCRARAPV